MCIRQLSMCFYTHVCAFIYALYIYIAELPILRVGNKHQSFLTHHTQTHTSLSLLFEGHKRAVASLSLISQMELIAFISITKIKVHLQPHERIITVCR